MQQVTRSAQRRFDIHGQKIRVLIGLLPLSSSLDVESTGDALPQYRGEYSLVGENVGDGTGGEGGDVGSGGAVVAEDVDEVGDG